VTTLPDRIDTHLTLFPGFAIRTVGESNNQWDALVAGVAISNRTKKIRRRFLINLLGRLMDATPEQLQTDICRDRTEPFFQTPVRAASVQFSIGEQVFSKLARTKRNGHFRSRIAPEVAPREPFPDSVTLRAAIAEQSVGNELHLLDSEGTSVISDIDDTIKFSNVENRAELLANTFLREFQAIPDMIGVYRGLADSHASFHYVTASPWQLCRPLQQFMGDFGYPAGSMHFRTFRLSDHLLKRMGVIHRGGKSAAVRRILASCPHRKFILIGDSGEKDTEIYTRCFRDHPHAIRRILIRLVRPEHRYRESIIRAKIALPNRVFATFESGQQLGNLLGRV
jgi:phosphatidate phosphatase APP1